MLLTTSSVIFIRASDDWPPACGQEPNISKNITKKIHEALYKVAPAKHPIEWISGQPLFHKCVCVCVCVCLCIYDFALNKLQ